MYRADRCRMHYDRYRAMHDRAAAARSKLPQSPRWSASRCYVYAVLAENGLVKIGSAVDPKQRVRFLQGQSPVVVKLTLLGFIPGNQAMERMIHRHLKGHRAHGEWFRPEGKVLDVVEAIQDCDLQKLSEACDYAYMDVNCKRPKSPL